MQKVLDAKLAFATTLILAFGLVYWAASWRYGGVIDNYESSQQAKEERHKAELLEKRQLPSLTTDTKPKLVTISSNEIALSGPGTYLVDTENKTDSDDLKKIYELSEGDEVTLKAADNNRTIVIKKGII